MNKILSIILPSGKVHPKYLQFVGWSFVSNVLVSTETVLAADSILTSVDGTCSDAMRTASYIGKDILGQMGSLYYISQVGSQADRKPLTFVKSSNVLQQASYGLICATPFLPTSCFLPVAGLGNMLSTVSFTGFGAINGKCIYELGENRGEIYAKTSLVNTLGSTLGMALGVGVVALIPDHSTRLILLPILGIGRYYTFNWAIDGLV